MYNYIITTDDISAANEKIEEIKKSLSSDYDDIAYDLEEDLVYSLIDELTTISLFDTPKFIVVKAAEAITGISDKASLELFSAMNNRESENVIIFLFTKDSDYYKSEKFQKLKKYSTLLDVRIKNISLDEYAKREFAKDGFQILDQTIALLASYVDSLSSLKRAIEILECYKYEEKKITSADVSLMVAKPLDDNVYQLIDQVLAKNIKEVFSIYHDLKIINVAPSFLISLLINKFQEMYNVSVLIKGNVTQAELASIFNVSSGRAYYMMKNAKSTNLSKIKDNLDYLCKLDENIKSGKVDQTLGLELFFLR